LNLIRGDIQLLSNTFVTEAGVAYGLNHDTLVAC